MACESRTKRVASIQWLALALVSAGVLVLSAGPGRADWPADADLVVTLEDATARPESPEQRKPLRLRLQRVGGIWHPLVVADTRVTGQVYNYGDHHGCVTATAEREPATVLDVRLRIESDPWSDTAGYARYHVTLTPDGDNAVKGTWSGQALGREGNGKASGTVLPAQPQPGCESPRPGEHPRLLIRRSQIPALRARTQTPAGRRDLERLRQQAHGSGSPTDRAVALGLLYQIEGDVAYAHAARDLLLGDIGNWGNVHHVHGAAVRVVEGALAFDLIYDACDDAFRDTMRDVFARKLAYLYYPPVGGFNPKDGSNWSAMYRSALGMAALVVCAEPAPLPPEPQAPAIPRLRGEPRPKRDVPVVPLQSGVTIGRWLFAGPFDVLAGTDVLTSLGGADKARPAAGTAVTVREQGKAEETTIPFAPVPDAAVIAPKWAQAYQEPRIAGGVDFAALTGRRYRTTTALHTVLHVTRPGPYRLEHSQTKMEAIGIWLGGRRIDGPVDTRGGTHYQQAEGGVVMLEEGYYPLTVLASVGVVGNWELIESYVRLVALSEEEFTAHKARQQDAYEHAHAVWQARQEARERLGPVDLDAQRWLAIARQRIALWSHNALGDAGWNHEGEAYTQHTLRLVLPFAHAYRNVTGRRLFEDNHLAMTFPLYATKTIFSGEGAVMPSYGPGGGPLGVDNWARGFGLVHEPHRAACLDAWDRTQALADAGKLDGPMQPVAQLDGVSAAMRLINHPGPALEPQAGAGLTPLTVDRVRGGVVFRNRWRDGDDAVVTWFADTAERGGGWNAPDAGAFRIFALGQRWAVRGISFGNGASSRKQENMRWYGNVVTVPEAPRMGSRPYATGLTVEPAGPQDEPAWIAGARFDNCYLGVRTEQRPGRERARTVAADVGVRATRQLAVDYSGKSGAPVLVAVADRLQGTQGDNTWQFCTLPEHEVTVNEDGFTIEAADGASLKATFVAPAEPKVTVHKVTIRHEINYHGRHQQRNLPRQVIEVRGGERFFVVMTIQRGEPPRARTASSGPTLRAVVNGRAMQFGPEQLHLGPAAQEP